MRIKTKVCFKWMKTNKQTKPQSHVNAFAVQIKCDKIQQRRISHSQHRIILKSRRLNCDKYIPYVPLPSPSTGHFKDCVSVVYWLYLTS